ncbi:hypothetical protein TNCT_63461 [Trichonephila clavata]|uniref:Uncharacterized protein n=1 Tax=Trichonephila clavata TaxID=2740835 RepID=A0A8X6J297_TRICU|nr:hypothetical protein TNCT_63461 [Trichonephila clavata]
MQSAKKNPKYHPKICSYMFWDNGGFKIRNKTGVSCLRASTTTSFLLHLRRAKNGLVFGAVSCNQVFCMKLGKNRTETIKMLQEFDGDRATKQKQAFMRHKSFPEGRKSVNDDKHLGPLLTSLKDDSVQKVCQGLDKD